MSRLIVRKEFRNQGIGGKMVDFLIGEARRRGYTELTLGVDLDNAVARRLYQNKGFDQVLYQGGDAYGPYLKLLKKL